MKLSFRQSGPKVSVLVRTIGRDSLWEAIESVEAQSYANIELVIINALGLPDLDTKISTRHSSLKHVSGNSQLHRSAAANLGLREASGDYLIFLDDDDIFNEGHIVGLLDAIDKAGAKKYSVAYSSVECVFGNDSQIAGEMYDRHRLMAGNYIPLHSVLFSRTFVDAGCRFDEELEICEDWDFWLQLAQYADFNYVNQVSAVYRCSGESGVGPGEALVDNDLLARSRERVIEKWKSRWTAADINKMLKAHESQAENRVKRDLQRVIKELQDQIAALKTTKSN